MATRSPPAVAARRPTLKRDTSTVLDGDHVHEFASKLVCTQVLTYGTGPAQKKGVPQRSTGPHWRFCPTLVPSLPKGYKTQPAQTARTAREKRRPCQTPVLCRWHLSLSPENTLSIHNKTRTSTVTDSRHSSAGPGCGCPARRLPEAQDHLQARVNGSTQRRRAQRTPQCFLTWSMPLTLCGTGLRVW